MTTENFGHILQQEGGLSKVEASRVTTFFGAQGFVQVLAFEDYLKKVLQNQLMNSPALHKFHRLLQAQHTGESIARLMLAQDHNRDALIGIDGFKAAMLAQEVGFRPDEAAQVFGLV